jgi:protein TonB
VFGDDQQSRERSSDPVLSKAFLSAHRMPGHSRQTTIVYSVAVHTVLLIAVLLLPLWFTDALDPARFMVTLLAAPPQLMTAPAPPAAAVQDAAAAQAPVRRVFMRGNRLLFPTAIPKHAAIISEGPLEPAIGSGGVFGGVYGGLPGGTLGSELFGGIAEPAPPPPALPAEPVVEGPRQPLPVGGDVRPPKLIHQVEPVYPRLAKQARLEGDVVLSAIINEKGDVTELKVLSGPPLLYSAALDAVRHWKFEPTYLNGKPWPVSHEVTIHFRL